MANETTSAQARTAWNAGRPIGPKPPLKPKDIWAIRARLRHQRRIRDLALFNIAINSKLQGCDLAHLSVADSVLAGSVRPRASVTQHDRPACRVRTDGGVARGSAGVAEGAPRAEWRLVVP